MLSRAATELDAANGALGHLSEAQLTSLDENRLAARVIKKAFGAVRDSLLRRHVWNFAQAHTALTQDPSIPPARFSYGFPLPPDCLRVNEVEKLSADSWEVAAPSGPQQAVQLAGTLYCNTLQPNIFYNRRVTNVALWDPLFLEVFELMLAARIGGQLGRSASETEAWETRAERKLNPARRIDEREKARSRVPGIVPFVSVRA